MPVLMRPTGLIKAFAFRLGLAGFAAEQPLSGEHSIDGSRADGDNIRIHHHIGQPAVSIERVFIMEADDGLAFPAFQPMVARDTGIMLELFTIRSAPLIECGFIKSDPFQDGIGRQLGAILPILHIVDDGISNFVGNPFAVQSSPLAFFNLTCSSSSSATTSFLV